MDDRDALARAEGLHNKFIVERWDGRHRPGEKHDGCQYLVLDLTHDVHALAAVAAYADAAERDRPAFVDDLRRTYLAATSRPDVGDLRERVREAIAQAMSIETHNPMPYTVTTDAVLATRPAPEGHPLDRLCNDPAPALNLPGAMPVSPKVYCARAKGHERPHAHGEMTWDTLPAPVVSGEALESVKADIAGWLKRNHTHTPSDGCRTCEWRAQEIGHLVDLWALHLGALPAPVVSGDDPLRVEVCRLLAEFADITKRREITLGYIESRLAGAVTVADAPEAGERA